MFLSPLMVLEYFAGVSTFPPSTLYTSDCSLGQKTSLPVSSQNFFPCSFMIIQGVGGHLPYLILAFFLSPFVRMRGSFFIPDMVFVQTHISSYDPSIWKEKTSGIVNLHTVANRT